MQGGGRRDDQEGMSHSHFIRTWTCRADGYEIKSTTEEVKKMLLANTERAVASGAFGLPWFECTNSKGDVESFFGVDHLGQIAAFLNLETSSDKSRGFRCVL